MKYAVTFVQEYYYEVEADNENNAEDLAYRKFYSDVCRPVANTHYDDVEIEELEDDYDM